MRLPPIIIVVIVSLAWSAKLLAVTDQEIRADRARLERIFAEQCKTIQADATTLGHLQALIRVPGRTLVFLPRSSFGTPEPALNELTRKYGEALVKLGEQALEDGDHAALAYQLFQQAVAFDQNARSRSLFGQQKDEAFRPSLAGTNHPRLPWKRQQYWRVSSPHYQIVTNQSARAGVEIARRLEDLYSVWQQLFFAYWSSPTELQSAWRRSRSLKPKSNRKHRVVLFASREQYVEFLRPRQPRIEISLGFYDVDSETSYFFAGPDSSSATQLHEATHQLFQETKSTSSKLTMRHNFWAIEGIAMYLESLQVGQLTASVGGLDANRLQFARYRCLQEQFYLPLAELVAIGRAELQRDSRIRRIYSQAAGLTHFLMDGQGGKYRTGLIRYLRSIYEGRDQVDLLAQATGTPLSQLDREYLDFLDVNDQELESARIQCDSLRSLCLGATSVGDQGLRAIPRQSQLEWLDLAGTSTSDAGLGFIAKGDTLRQLNLDGTGITNKTLERLASNTGLEELDLSNTGITDEGLRSLAGLPQLRVLWLDGTRITDASVASLCTLRSLEQLGLSRTKVTESGRKLLRGKFPTLAID